MALRKRMKRTEFIPPPEARRLWESPHLGEQSGPACLATTLPGLREPLPNSISWSLSRLLMAWDGRSQHICTEASASLLNLFPSRFQVCQAHLGGSISAGPQRPGDAHPAQSVSSISPSQTWEFHVREIKYKDQNLREEGVNER